MIISFADRDTEKLFNRASVRKFKNFERVALRKLAYLDAAEKLQDLQQPPGNRLEALKGNRKGQYSIRINQQWRICFRWSDGDVSDVEIVDYHD